MHTVREPVFQKGGIKRLLVAAGSFLAFFAITYFLFHHH